MAVPKKKRSKSQTRKHKANWLNLSKITNNRLFRYRLYRKNFNAEKNTYGFGPALFADILPPQIKKD